MREDIIKKVLDEKLIVIVRGLQKDKMIPLAEAMYKGGIRLIEVTYDANNSLSHVDTAESISLINKHFGGDMLVGAGTVLTTKQVEMTKKAGGSYIISPNVNSEVIKKTIELNMVSMPGAFSPTEIETAHECGADFVKVFPASQLGTSYIKAIMAPLSHIKMIAVGGIDHTNIKDFKSAGIVCFGAGSNIVNKKALAEGNFEAITELAKRFVDEVQSI